MPVGDRPAPPPHFAAEGDGITIDGARMAGDLDRPVVLQRPYRRDEERQSCHRDAGPRARKSRAGECAGRKMPIVEVPPWAPTSNAHRGPHRGELAGFRLPVRLRTAPSMLPAANFGA